MTNYTYFCQGNIRFGFVTTLPSWSRHQRLSLPYSGQRFWFRECVLCGTFETNGLVWNKLAASKLLLWKRKEMARCLEKEMPRTMKIYRPSMEVMHQLKYILSKRGKKSLQTLAKSASLKSSLEWSILCNLCFTLQRKSIYCTKKYCHFYKLVDFCAKSLMMEPDPAVEWNKDKKTKQFNKFSLHIFISVHELVIPRW